MWRPPRGHRRNFLFRKPTEQWVPITIRAQKDWTRNIESLGKSIQLLGIEHRDKLCREPIGKGVTNCKVRRRPTKVRDYFQTRQPERSIRFNTTQIAQQRKEQRPGIRSTNMPSEPTAPKPNPE